MNREIILDMFRNNTVNMQEICFRHEDLTKADLAALCQEIYYAAYGWLLDDEVEIMNRGIAKELEDRWT